MHTANLSIANIIEALGCITFIGKSETRIAEVVQFDPTNERDDVIFWCSNKNLHLLEKVQHGIVICSQAAMHIIPKQCHAIIVENPRLYFARMIKHFFYHPPIRIGISASAKIHPSSTIGSDCYIGENVVIEENCKIGDFCFIDHNSVLHQGTILKNNVKVGCNNSIGGFGFGYEKNELGEYEPLPHIGNVVIEDNVELCNNCCIDRAAVGSTFINKNVKISNLVHIGHGVRIDENSLIIANAMVAGSTSIGKNVWVAPSSSLMNKISVGDNAVIGLSAVVLKSVKENTVVVGNPAKEINSIK